MLSPKSSPKILPMTEEGNKKHLQYWQPDYSCNYRIYYEDTDSGGVVYYANYLKFCERARTDFLHSLAISQNQLKEQEGIIFVVKSCTIDYLKPAKLDDIITVELKITTVKVASIIFIQKIYNQHHHHLINFSCEVVSIDSSNFRPKKIPQSLKNILYVR
jgi:acyl-CoA thioester hydrolase